MDFSIYSTVEKAEQGVKLYLRDPFTKEKLEGEPYLVVLGADSPKVKRALSKFERVRENPNKSQDEIDEAALDFIDKVIIDFNGIEYRGEKLKDIRILFKEVPIFLEQVMAFMGDRQNFLPEREKPSKTQSEKKSS